MHKDVREQKLFSQHDTQQENKYTKSYGTSKNVHLYNVIEFAYKNLPYSNN